LIRPFRSTSRRRSGSGILFFVEILVVGLTLLATSMLLDTDVFSLCDEEPFSALGEHCGATVRGVILLIPIAIGMILGARWRAKKRSRRRRDQRP
jgi:hypothetical protein